MRSLSIIVLLLGLWTTAYAGVPTLEDFAYGLVLEMDGDGAIYRITLPQDVYRNVTRADLSDMRVFNRRGEVVPHTVRRPTAPRAEVMDPVSLPFFPLYGAEGSTSNELSLHIVRDKKGTIIDFKSEGSGKEKTTVNAYLVDASSLKQPASKLDLAWTHGGESFVTTVTVEYTDDLTNWHPLVSAATLAELRYDKHNLGQHTIVMPRQEVKYLRISWPAGAQGARLTSVKAIFPRMVYEHARQWTKATARYVTGDLMAYEFNSNAMLPVDRMNVQLPERNSLVEAVLKSRGNEEMPWRVRCSGVFYNLHVDGVALVSDTISMPLTTDRYWRLEINPNSGGMPVLELGWVPHDLLFLARGEAPFKLAYGSVRIEPHQRPDSLLRTINKQQEGDFIKEAHVGVRIELGGEAMLVPPRPPLPWKQWLLWIVLVTGVLLAGWMAWRLYRQMNPQQ
ncbi:MAG: DUF3999 domain-containing protein [Pseudomonadota bacterium]